MPYSNIPKEKWNEMDRCVKEIMNQQKLSKERAIVICYSSIMGKKVEGGEKNMTDEINKAVWTTVYINDLSDDAFAYIEPGGKKDKDGKTVPRSLRHLPYKDANGKVDPAHVRNALARLPQTNISEEAKIKAKAKLVVAAKQVGIDVSEKIDSLKGGEKNMTDEIVINEEELEKQADKDEVKDKTSYVACMKMKMKEGMEMADAAKECKKMMEDHDKKAEDANPVSETKEEIAGEASASEKKEEEAVEEISTEKKPTEEEIPAKETADKTVDLVKQVLDRINSLEASLKKDDNPASPEGAASEDKNEEIAPEGGVKEAPKEEATSEDASPEGAEINKVVTENLTKISDKMEKLEKSLNDKLGSLEDRINKLEEQPVPSKVVSPKIVSKTEDSNPNKERIEEITKELTILEEMKKSDMDRYQKEKKWEKAFSLIAEKNRLMQV